MDVASCPLLCPCLFVKVCAMERCFTTKTVRMYVEFNFLMFFKRLYIFYILSEKFPVCLLSFREGRYYYVCFPIIGNLCFGECYTVNLFHSFNSFLSSTFNLALLYFLNLVLELRV